MKSYIEFKYAGTSESGKTCRYIIKSLNKGDILGYISWYSPWRQCVFKATATAVWSDGCLEEIRNFLNTLNKEKN